MAFADEPARGDAKGAGGRESGGHQGDPRSAGFRYILGLNSNEGNGLLCGAMLGHEAQWGLEKTAEVGPAVLFRIKQQ
jgi:hypothetical protein